MAAFDEMREGDGRVRPVYAGLDKWLGDLAAEAFAAKRATCQGLTHVFIAVGRVLGVPMRYVFGYLHRPDGAGATNRSQAQNGSQSQNGHAQNEGDQDNGHAWAEAHVPDLGWVGFDPANGLCVTDRYIRVAIGLDGLGAARVRGAHYGGGRETAAVMLRVTQASRQAQE